MTRHMVNPIIYGSDTSLEYRHSSRAPITHEGYLARDRSNPRADPMARQPNRPGGQAPHLVNAVNAAATPRRRIPVACGRCRKRKIRCSGDPGDNSGCKNCKQAGVGPGLCVFLRVQCEMRELVPDHVLMMSGYEQVSSATLDLHPYSSSSSASSSCSSLQLSLPHPMHSTMGQQHLMSGHTMRAGGHHHGMHSNAMSMKSLYHQDPMSGSSGGGDNSSGMLLSGGMGITHRTHYDGLGGDMAGGAVHVSSNSGMSVGGGDIYNGNYPQYMHPDISQGVANPASVLHGQHGHWSSLGGRQSSSLYIEQDQSPMGYISTNPGGYPMFPALTSLSSSLPDGISPRANEKVQLPLPIRTQASEVTNITSSRPPTTGGALGSDTTPPTYGTQSLQAPYGRSYNSWGADHNFSSTASSNPLPTLPTPSGSSAYGPHFPLSSSNISLLPNLSHNSVTSSAPIDSFSLPHAHHQQKDRSNSESSNESKSITPTQTRTNSSTNSPYTPSHPRSSDNSHGTQQPQKHRNFNKVY